ncbi:hypothetical protein Poly21_08760 [Allorhodopirellula heiligendammensis]|uniref:Uncharacterized protein n=1 Tax=Allorhodopirellula heiligendammensis TaxID=2714739 RepID=A0A5C6C2B8_9BACT|nr:hypothetical protein Poly21_08760 [Allorhodopirellula heiligendammensis]
MCIENENPGLVSVTHRCKPFPSELPSGTFVSDAGGAAWAGPEILGRVSISKQQVSLT